MGDNKSINKKFSFSGFTKKNINHSVNFFNKFRIIFYIFLVIIFIFLFFILFVNKNSDYRNNQLIKDHNGLVDLVDNCEDDCSMRLIDGVLVDGPNNPFIVSAIIDNHSYARPQFSLSLARVVYDIPAEGGINRYLAFFLSNDNILKIGPIRSARPYFLDIAKEYGSLLLHCGGSPDALAKISQEKLLTLNEFYNEKYFSRVNNYKAPHNIVASFNDIKEYLLKNNLQESNINPWKFNNANNDREQLDLSISNFFIKIKNGQHQYDVEWSYDLGSGVYFKKIANQNHSDDSNEIISANNLVLQFIQTQILDSDLRLKINLIGRGDAIICLNGVCSAGYWQKNDNNSRTIYYYDNDAEVIFNSGKTWIHFIDERSKIEIDNFIF